MSSLAGDSFSCTSTSLTERGILRCELCKDGSASSGKGQVESVCVCVYVSLSSNRFYRQTMGYRISVDDYRVAE